MRTPAAPLLVFLVLTACGRGGSVSVDELYMRGLAAATEEQHREAITDFNSALSREPRRAEILASRAASFLVLGDLSRALSDLESALLLEADNAAYLSNRSQVYRRFGRTDEAMADVNRAIELDSNLVAARFNRGTLLVEQWEYEAALADFDFSIEGEPGEAPPYFNRAVTHWELGNHDAARRDIASFIGLSGRENWTALAREMLAQWNNDSTDTGS